MRFCEEAAVRRAFIGSVGSVAAEPTLGPARARGVPLSNNNRRNRHHSFNAPKPAAKATSAPARNRLTSADHMWIPARRIILTCHMTSSPACGRNGHPRSSDSRRQLYPGCLGWARPAGLADLSAVIRDEKTRARSHKPQIPRGSRIGNAGRCVRTWAQRTSANIPAGTREGAQTSPIGSSSPHVEIRCSWHTRLRGRILNQRRPRGSGERHHCSSVGVFASAIEAHQQTGIKTPYPGWHPAPEVYGVS